MARRSPAKQQAVPGEHSPSPLGNDSDGTQATGDTAASGAQQQQQQHSGDKKEDPADAPDSWKAVVNDGEDWFDAIKRREQEKKAEEERCVLVRVCVCACVCLSDRWTVPRAWCRLCNTRASLSRDGRMERWRLKVN